MIHETVTLCRYMLLLLLMVLHTVAIAFIVVIDFDI